MTNQRGRQSNWVGKGLGLPRDVADRLASLHLNNRTDELAHLCAALYRRWWPLSTMSDVLGCTRQYIDILIRRGGPWDTFPDVPELPPREIKHDDKLDRSRPVPEDVIDELKTLHALAKRRNGANTDNPEIKAAAEEFTRRLADLINNQGYSSYRIAKQLGVNVHGIYSRLGRYGYRKLSPSQQAHRITGVPWWKDPDRPVTD
jgi:hypothetical protein